MGRASESVLVEAPASAVWDLYFDRTRWRGWVDGFGDVSRWDDRYPETGARIQWDSKPGGRGRVLEEVLIHDPRSLHRIRFEDQTALGFLETEFEPQGQAACRVTATVEYAVKDAGPLNFITDALFIRRSMAQSIGRSLTRLKRDVEGDQELLR